MADVVERDVSAYLSDPFNMQLDMFRTSDCCLFGDLGVGLTVVKAQSDFTDGKMIPALRVALLRRTTAPFCCWTWSAHA